MSNTFQSRGKTFTVVYALMHDSFESAAKELTERASVQSTEIMQLLADIDRNKTFRGRSLSLGLIEPVFEEDGSLKRTEAEMSNYQQTLYDTLLKKPELTKENIQNIHSCLFSKETEHGGKFKTRSNDLHLPTENPFQNVIIATTPQQDTCRELGYLIRWANKHLSKGSFHPLIVISTFIYEFLLIHPFQDGNGRTSRILTHLLLLRAGYAFAESTSLDKIIHNDRWIHSEVLMKEAFKRNENTIMKINLWVKYYLITIKLMQNQLIL